MRHPIVAVLLVVLATACGTEPSDVNTLVDAGTAPDAGEVSDGGTVPSEETDAGMQTTWYRDVLPIVQTRCLGCHLEGGIAPFALDDYAVASSMHLSIADAVATRRMPPWKPDDACMPLKHSRRLAEEEMQTIAAWSAQGAPEGDPADAPPPPSTGPGLEWVDATLAPEAAYMPNAGVADDYRCFVVPPALAAQQDIIGFDVVPGTPNQVHHVILFAAPEADARALDDAEEGLGWTCYGGPGVATTNVRMIGGWVPGTTATRYPENTGVRIKAGNVVIMQVHYNLESGAPQEDLTQVRLQYAKAPVAEPALIFPITVDTFTIPPNSTGYTASETFSLSQIAPSFVLPSVKIYGVTPHMHELGRRITVTNTTTEQCLVDIPDWEFHWQQGYAYETPFSLQNADVVELSCTWDNPTSQSVSYGEGTADEMCVNFFYTTGIPAEFL